MQGPDDEICLCFHVTRRKIENFVRREQPCVPSLISACGGAGTGCGWCIPFLKQIHRRILAGDAEAGVSIEEYRRRRAAWIAAGHGTAPAGEQEA